MGCSKPYNQMDEEEQEAFWKKLKESVGDPIEAEPSSKVVMLPIRKAGG